MNDLIDRQEALDAVGLTTWAGSRISKLPTIEAIPIEWIDKYIKRRVKVAGMYAEMLYISDMLEDWERENEINN